MKHDRLQAKDLDESAILSLLMENPGEWHTYPSEHPSCMPTVLDPTHPDAPRKVLVAKLRSMKRRGLVDGCDCGCRGDWHAPPLPRF